MTIGTTSRTAHLLAFMKKGATYIRVLRAPARRPGPLSRLLSRSLAVCVNHAACVTPAHPVRQEAQEGAQRDRAHQPRRLT